MKSILKYKDENIWYRMSTDGKLPVDKRKGYSNAFNAIFRIAKEEKVTALWQVWALNKIF